MSELTNLVKSVFSGYQKVGANVMAGNPKAIISAGIIAGVHSLTLFIPYEDLKLQIARDKDISVSLSEGVISSIAATIGNTGRIPGAIVDKAFGTELDNAYIDFCKSFVSNIVAPASNVINSIFEGSSLEGTFYVGIDHVSPMLDKSFDTEVAVASVINFGILNAAEMIIDGAVLSAGGYM